MPQTQITDQPRGRDTEHRLKLPPPHERERPIRTALQNKNPTQNQHNGSVTTYPPSKNGEQQRTQSGLNN